MDRSGNRRFLLAGCSAAMALLASCSNQENSSSRSPYQREENQVREAVFRDLLKDTKPGEVCFLAFGRSNGGGWVDPPQEFMQHMAILHLTLRRASEARFPESGEMDPENPQRYQG